jgi:hemerythrin-like domain-containing protein
MQRDRRSFLLSTAGGVAIAACGGARPATGAKPEGEEEDVTPSEDLMREHGFLRRVAFLYDDAARRLDEKQAVPLDALASAATIVQRFIESYHEKMEEELVFPRFEKAQKLADMTAVLRRQHVTGRELTAQILSLAKTSLADAERTQLAIALRHFDRLYRAHAAREDTVLFPALRELVGGKAYAELGEQMEDKEHEMLGEGGFEHAVDEVAKLEAAFGFDWTAV